MKVAELCTHRVVTISRKKSVLEAARQMREEHVGDLVVLDDETARPVGILTDRDIVVGVVAQDTKHLDKLDVGDVLLPVDLVTTTSDEDVSGVVRRMRSFGVRRIVVVDKKGQVEGVLALDDLVTHFAEEMGELAALVQRQPRLEARRRD